MSAKVLLLKHGVGFVMRHFLPRQSFQAIFDSFAEVGLDRERISDHFYSQKGVLTEYWGVMASINSIMSLWEHAQQLSKTPHLFVRAGLAVPFGSFGLVDHLVFTADTVEDGLLQLQKYIPLVSSTTRLEYAEVEDDIEVRIYNRPYFPLHDHVDRWLLGMFIKRAREMLGEDFEFPMVFLRPLQKRDPTLDDIVGTPVLPHPMYTGVRLSKEAWQSPAPNTDPALHLSLQKAAEEMMFQRFSSAPIAYAVWNVMSGVFDSELSVGQAVSDRLGIPLRTLQRRLRKEKLSLKELVESYRKQEALHLLGQRLFSISEVAAKLGYHEHSSFTRSFKRWMGVSPRSWLRELAKHAGFGGGGEHPRK
ncbi:MAG: AraC family transcriptional regulator [Deltaproteobacteria bacterium]|nr:MAG: AraC family transcriptional regulator [Deltaproteobacteria bacterium]